MGTLNIFKPYSWLDDNQISKPPVPHSPQIWWPIKPSNITSPIKFATSWGGWIHDFDTNPSTIRIPWYSHRARDASPHLWWLSLSFDAWITVCDKIPMVHGWIAIHQRVSIFNTNNTSSASLWTATHLLNSSYPPCLAPWQRPLGAALLRISLGLLNHIPLLMLFKWKSMLLNLLFVLCFWRRFWLWCSCEFLSSNYHIGFVSHGPPVTYFDVAGRRWQSVQFTKQFSQTRPKAHPAAPAHQIRWVLNWSLVSISVSSARLRQWLNPWSSTDEFSRGWYPAADLNVRLKVAWEDGQKAEGAALTEDWNFLNDRSVSGELTHFLHQPQVHGCTWHP